MLIRVGVLCFVDSAPKTTVQVKWFVTDFLTVGHLSL